MKVEHQNLLTMSVFHLVNQRAITSNKPILEILGGDTRANTQEV